MSSVTLSFPTQTEQQNAYARGLCARLATDPHVATVVRTDDPARPFRTVVEITYALSHTRPFHRDLHTTVLTHVRMGKIIGEFIEGGEEAYAQLTGLIKLRTIMPPPWLVVGAQLQLKEATVLDPVTVLGFGPDLGTGPSVIFDCGKGLTATQPLADMISNYIPVPPPITSWARLISNEDAF